MYGKNYVPYWKRKMTDGRTNSGRCGKRVYFSIKMWKFPWWISISFEIGKPNSIKCVMNTYRARKIAFCFLFFYSLSRHTSQTVILYLRGYKHVKVHSPSYGWQLRVLGHTEYTEYVRQIWIHIKFYMIVVYIIQCTYTLHEIPVASSIIFFFCILNDIVTCYNVTYADFALCAFQRRRAYEKVYKKYWLVVGVSRTQVERHFITIHFMHSLRSDPSEYPQIRLTAYIYTNEIYINYLPTPLDLLIH